MLRDFIGERKIGFLFKSRVGEPLCQTNVLKRSLHSILESMKSQKASDVVPGVPKNEGLALFEQAPQNPL